MFRTVNDQPTSWESILAEQFLRLPVELARVDALLEDSRVLRAVLVSAPRRRVCSAERYEEAQHSQDERHWSPKEALPLAR